MLLRVSLPHGRFAGALALVALATACGGSGSGAKASSERQGVHGTIELAVGAVSVASAGAQVTLPDQVRDQVVDAVRRYVDGATVQPLQTGKPVGDLAPVLTDPALVRAQGFDRATLVDEGLPKATADVVAKAQPVTVTALADPTGKVVLVDAALALTVDTTTDRGPVRIRRDGDLVLAPDGGAWKILGFDLRVTRSGKGVGDADRAENP